jgi:hypothetical protein
LFKKYSFKRKSLNNGFGEGKTSRNFVNMNYDFLNAFISRNAYLSVKPFGLILLAFFEQDYYMTILCFTVISAIKSLIDQNESVRLLDSESCENTRNIKGLYLYLYIFSVLFIGVYMILFNEQFFKRNLCSIIVILLGDVVKPFNFLFIKKTAKLFLVGCVQAFILIVGMYTRVADFTTLFAFVSVLDIFISFYIVITTSERLKYVIIFEKSVLILSFLSFLYAAALVETSNLHSNIKEILADKEKYLLLFNAVYPVLRMLGKKTINLYFVFTFAVSFLSLMLTMNFWVTAFVFFTFAKLFLQSDAIHARFSMLTYYLLLITELVIVTFLLLHNLLILVVVSQVLLLVLYFINYKKYVIHTQRCKNIC